MPKFSFLIANFNNGKFFSDCYKSIIAQTIQDWEVVILDDCSTDESLVIINDLIKDDSRFRVYKNELNKGIGFTKRKLIEYANSEICGFLDPDDALENNAIEIITKAHFENPHIGLIYSNFTYCDEFLNKQTVHKTKQINALDESYYNFKGEISSFATFKKSIYQKTTGIDPFLKIAEDKDWYMKMCEVAPVLHIDKSLYLYRVHDGGISSSQNAEKAAFWHWIAMMKMSERTGASIDEIFLEQYTRKSYFDYEKKLNEQHLRFRNKIKKSKWLKLGHFLGLFKNYNEL